MTTAKKPAPAADFNAETLNGLMDRLDATLGRLEIGTRSMAGETLALLDEIDERFTAMAGQPDRLTAERAQLAYLQRRVENNASRLLAALGGAAALRLAREQDPHRSERWWWRLDDLLAKKRRRSLKRALIGILAAVAALAAVALLYRYVLAPDPAVVKVFELENSAASLIAMGDYNGALKVIDEGLALAPDDEALLLNRGVAWQLKGDTVQAQAAWQAAEQALGSRALFLQARSATWLRFNDGAQALADAQAALAIDPQSPETCFYQARAYELLGNYPAALESYQAASSLAGEQGKPQLEASARVSMAMLMQRMNAQPAVTESAPAN